MHSKLAGRLIAVLFLVSTLLIIIFTQFNSKNTEQVGIIIPMQHQALSDIVSGFKEKLSVSYKKPIDFVIKNAQGDINIQHGILQSFNRNPNIKLVVTIGTATTEMAMNNIKNKPILAIAAQLNEKQRLRSQNPNITGLMDEFPPEKTMQLIQAVQPGINNLTVVYSSDPKIFSTVNKLDKLIQKNYPNIKLNKILVTQLSDLYTITQRIDNKTQGVLVFKDSLIVSGINTLAKKVNALKIPLITSDEGSVSHGASYALGVSEKQIGIAAVPIAKQLLTQRVSANKIPLTHMQNPKVFYNSNTLHHNDVTVPQLQLASKNLHYILEDTHNHG